MMKNTIKKCYLYCIGLAILFYSSFVFADDVPVIHIHDYFQTAKYDVSRILLARIFGHIGGVLGVTRDSALPYKTLFGDMFKVFNHAMMALCAILFMYTLVISILNTAHQGEFLGKKLDSMWVPLRSIAGFALIIPNPASGYCMIQVFIMWVIVQGIGAADTLWNTIVDDVMTGKTPLTTPTVSAKEGIISAQSILRSAICMQDKGYKNWDPTTPREINVAIGKVSVLVRAYTFGPQDSYCGYVYYPGFDPQKTAKEGYAVYSSDSSAVLMREKLPEVIDALNNVAIAYAPKKDASAIASGKNPLSVVVGSLVQAFQQKADQEGKTDIHDINKQLRDEMKDFGWINAGAYYYRIVTTNESYADKFNFSQYMKIQGYDANSGSDSSKDVDMFLNTLSMDALNSNFLPSTRGDASSGFDPLGGGWTSMLIFAPMVDGLVKAIIPDLINMINNKDNSNPILAIQKLGHTIVNRVEWTWLVMMLVIGITTAFAYICSSTSSAGFVLSGIFKYICTPIFWVTGLIFVPGLTMSVYIPLIPYIIFVFAVIGWLMAVVESMIAAPLVAIGVAHPEGQHEVYGRAEPAVQLIMNLFLRPTLMVFGLIAGMLISVVSVKFVNTMFSFVANSVINGNIIFFVLTLVIYVSLVIAILNRSYSMIHLVPDQVFRWIGNQQGFGEYSKGGEEQVKQGFGAGAQAAKGAHDAAGQDAKRGSEAQIGRFKRARQHSVNSGDTGFSDGAKFGDVVGSKHKKDDAAINQPADDKKNDDGG